MKKEKAVPLANSEAIEARLNDIERKLDRLKGLYESFFMGVERMPPNVPRRELNRLFLETQQVPIHNASLRFRFSSLLQRWVQHTTLWNRTLREIEAGTYRRDLARVQRHLATHGGALTEAEAITLGVPLTRVKAFVDNQNRLRERLETKQKPLPGEDPDTDADGRAGAAPAPAGRAAATAPRPPATSPSAPLPGVSDEAFRSFYGRYADAHLQATGAPPKVSIDQLRDKLGKELPRILADRKASRIDLDVEIDGGKVRLKAKPVR